MMKKRLIILGLFLLSSALNLLSAQDSTKIESFLFKNEVDRSFYIDQQLDIYTNIASNLWLWEYEDYSVLSFKGDYKKGSFRRTDHFDQNAFVSFQTSSIQTINESGWRFFGDFKLELGNHKETNWNLFYQDRNIGSPFRLMIERVGDFNTKHYGLNGLINKKFGERLLLGVTLKYHGDLFLRIRDIRNEQYNLSTEFGLSATYKLSKKNHIGIGLSYAHNKSQPEFSAQVMRSLPEFYINIPTGLGDFTRIEMSQRMYILNSNPKLYLNYFNTKRNRFSLSYSIFMGKELWKNLTSHVNSSLPEELYKYEYFENELNASYLIREENIEFLNKMHAQYINGEGFENRSGFQRTYKYSGLNASFSSSLLRKNKNIFRESSLVIGFENVSKKDMVNAHLIEYTNINAGIQSSLIHKIKNTTLRFILGGLYNYNLSYTHNVMAATQKPYTLNIAYNEVAYHTANYLKLNTGIRVITTIKKLHTEFIVNYSYQNPLDIKVSNAHSLIEKTDLRHFWNASINLYF